MNKKEEQRKMKKEDWRYKAIVWLNIMDVILIFGIIYFASKYSWWLLLFLLVIGSSDSEKRILGLKENDWTINSKRYGMVCYKDKWINWENKTPDKTDSRIK